MIFKRFVIVRPQPGKPVIEVERTFSDRGKDFTVLSTGHGVTFNASPLFSEHVHTQRFARAFGDAWKDHLAIRRTGMPDPEFDEVKDDNNEQHG